MEARPARNERPENFSARSLSERSPRLRQTPHIESLEEAGLPLKVDLNDCSLDVEAFWWRRFGDFAGNVPVAGLGETSAYGHQAIELIQSDIYERVKLKSI